LPLVSYFYSVYYCITATYGKNGLQPWAAKKMDTDIADVGPNTYRKVFELLLRLKGNYNLEASQE
jgi:hypothetical protein